MQNKVPRILSAFCKLSLLAWPNDSRLLYGPGPGLRSIAVACSTLPVRAASPNLPSYLQEKQPEKRSQLFICLGFVNPWK